ncbi:hypothetical protein ACFYU9_35400 [Streptomyces sp. NPDC004327]|uniref:hypothetical protein n=1 Tax=Streptomyces sp. NPDC004327 TaxID=3364699 RepID=UPI003676C45F
MMTIKVYRVRPDGTAEAVSYERYGQPTQRLATSSRRRCAGGWCDFHRGPSSTAALVGGNRHACAPCREQRGLAVQGYQ